MKLDMQHSEPNNPKASASPHRSFDWTAQHGFARFSGDRNPMHMDAVAARRTQAGQPVVHGMHQVLWALELVASHQRPALPLAQIKVRFQRLTYVGDTVTLETKSCDRTCIRAQLCVDGITVATINITYGEPMKAAIKEKRAAPNVPPSWPEEPVELSLGQMVNAAGWLAFAQSQEECAQEFSALTEMIGAKRVAALACMSRLVGMVCPGLHSMFSGFSVNALEIDDGPNAIHYQVTSVDERFRLIRQSVEGGGWSGVIESFARVPPVAQPSMDQFANLVRRDEFNGSSALIIGGSRGLGEATAKLIAAGGGVVTITYSVGLDDALEVQKQIQQWGAKCEIMPYDATKPAAGQLSNLNPMPASLYYFATSFIARRKSGLFVQSIFDDFMRVYVVGFQDLCHELLRCTKNTLSIFYPSSVFVENRPAEMTEYAMAKAAAEVLCADLARSRKEFRILVERLPRMLTDQTATVMPTEMATPLEVMLPIVRNLETPATKLSGAGDLS
jgi:acyl dehydratase/NAD(P)-dependent dehydrogenase (short-subunit alcohol dehydrogenase family)